MNILVVTTNSGLTYNIVRILNKMLIKPFILDSTNKPLYSSKFFCKKYFQYSKDEMGLDSDLGLDSFLSNFIDRINEICSKYNINIILPVDLQCIITISKFRNKLDSKIALPPILSCDKILKLNSKWQFSKLMDKLEIPQPQTLYLENPEQLNDISESIFPVIVKPLAMGGGAGIRVFNNKLDISAYLSSKQDYNILPLLIQKFINGKDIQAFIYAVDGNLKAWSICYDGRGRRSF